MEALQCPVPALHPALLPLQVRVPALAGQVAMRAGQADLRPRLPLQLLAAEQQRLLLPLAMPAAAARSVHLATTATAVAVVLKLVLELGVHLILRQSPPRFLRLAPMPSTA